MYWLFLAIDVEQRQEQDPEGPALIAPATVSLLQAQTRPQQWDEPPGPQQADSVPQRLVPPHLAMVAWGMKPEHLIRHICFSL